MELKNLDAHNADMTRMYENMLKYPRPNGIACPECGKELMDSDTMILTSNPPRRNVHCPSCGYIGYRVC